MILRVNPDEPCSEDKKLNKKKESSDYFRAFFWWSWRESNPRPNEEIISFLHAYLCLIFRATAEPKPSTIALSFKVSFSPQGRQELSPM